jgi:dinuclear metal center YbgI/SA1388 family protein
MVSRKELDLALASVAPLRFAETWDNTGWIVDTGGCEVACVLLTIDFTGPVLEEARQGGVNTIVAYHPPIFSGLKRMRQDEPLERLVMEAIQAGISIYSPHTALDATEGGMAEWLGRALGPGTMHPIAPLAADSSVGAGRFVQLSTPMTLHEAVVAVKRHLKLEWIRVSEGAVPDKPIRTMAVCPGAGGSLFERVVDVDLLLTGEMRHHDVLARKGRGTHVILTEHSNSERAYLPTLARRLQLALPGLEPRISERDRDPLQTA